MMSPQQIMRRKSSSQGTIYEQSSTRRCQLWSFKFHFNVL